MPRALSKKKQTSFVQNTKVFIILLLVLFIISSHNIPSKYRAAFKSLGSGYLNEGQFRPRVKKSLNLQISLLVGYFKKTSAFQSTLYALLKLFTVNSEQFQ